MKRITELFARTWESFLAADRTIKNVNRDFVEWHKGRKQFAVWVIFPENPKIESMWNAAKSHLSAFLYSEYLRQPHITLYVCGFLAEQERWPDDFPTAVQEAQINALMRGDLAPFDIELGHLSSFTTAPFFEVLDKTGGINKIRRTLESVSVEKRTAEYAPHLTVGLYDDHYPASGVAEKISTYQSQELIKIKVNKIALAAYDSSKIAGPLSITREFKMSSKEN